MLTPKQAFAAGFLTRCIDENLDCTSIELRVVRGLEKSASFSDIWKAFLGTTSGVASGVSGLGSKLLTTALVVPPIIGAAGGYLAASETDPDQLNAETVKKEELIAEYRRLAEQARRSASRRTYRAAI